MTVDTNSSTINAIDTCCITKMHKHIYLSIYTFILLMSSLATILVISFVSNKDISGFLKLIMSVAPMCLGVGSVIVIIFCVNYFKKRRYSCGKIDGSDNVKVELSNFIIQYINYYDCDNNKTKDNNIV